MAGEIASSLQGMQLGIEATRGTVVAANRIIDAWTFKDGPKAETQRSSPSGRLYDAGGSQVLNREWSEFVIDSSEMDYNSMIYFLSSVYDAITPSAHGSSSTAKDWSVTPPVASAANSKTYTIERGSADRAHKYGYGLLNKFGYKHDRKSASANSSGFAQRLTDNSGLTSSPTRIPVIPMSASHFNLYLDLTSGALGTTQLTKFISHEHSFDGVFNPAWFVNRSNPSFTGHVQMRPKPTGKILLEADSTGMAFLDYIRNGTTLFMRVDAQGLVIDNLQIVSLGSPSAGNFTLSYKAQTTSNIAFNASAATVQTAFTGLSSVGPGNAVVTGAAGGPYSIVFPQTGTLGQDLTAITGSGTGLTGGTFLITPSQSYDKFVHDMAINISAPEDFADSDGIFASPWTYTVVEDTTWGKAQILTATNLLTAL